MDANGPTPAEASAETDRALVERYHRLAIERSRGQPVPPIERPTIHWSELPEKPLDSPLYHEWNC
jgi:hypothetical protein